MEIFEDILEFSIDLFDTVFSLGINYIGYVRHKRNYTYFGDPKNIPFDVIEAVKFGPLGLHKFFPAFYMFPLVIVTSIYSLLLMITGKIAKYSLGYPIGIIIGGMSLCITALLNFMRTLKGASKPPTPTSAQLPQRSHIPTPKERLALRAFAEKKNVLQRKLTLLTQLIDGEVVRLNPLCVQHEQVVEDFNRLTSQLTYTTSDKYASKIFDYETKKRMVRSSCQCGQYAQSRHGCTICYTPMFISIEERIPIYGPDYEKITRATAACITIEAQLQNLSLQTANPPSVYVQRVTMFRIREKLANINLETVLEEKTLTHQLEIYKEILNKDVTPYFSEHHPTTFKKLDYLPISQYAELILASCYIQKIAPKNPTDEEKSTPTTIVKPKQSARTQLPEVLERKIAEMFVSSDVPNEDMKLIFARFKRS